jgi:hypothetical protein
MTDQPGSTTPPDDPSAALEFEFVDVHSARSELDATPSGIEERKNLEAGYWEAHRRRPVASDRALTGATIDWAVSLPQAVRPRNLCEQYPRVANMVAEVWPDLPRVTVLLDELLHDDRGGTRRGFPDDVKVDLDRLLKYATLLERKRQL